MRHDYLIVGKGLAGSTLAYSLIAKGKKVLVFDQEKESTSSKVAAGIINPVTGRRFVKSWRFDAFYEKAKSFYQAFEVENKVSTFQELEICRALFKHEEQNDFLAKLENEAYAPYLKEIPTDQNLSDSFKDALAWISIKAARLDFDPYLKAIKNKLVSLNSYRPEYFDISSLKQESNLWKYGSDDFAKVIFCEGYEMKNNPFFESLPTVPAKGDLLVVKVPDLQADRIYKHKCFLVPLLEPQTFWVGSTYQWDFEDEKPTEAKKAFLLEKLNVSLKLPFEVLAHKAAIRPTGKDRRPYLGESKTAKNIFLFNSFGTKGASLVPYWCEKMIDYLEDGVALDEEVDVCRF